MNTLSFSPKSVSKILLSLVLIGLLLSSLGINRVSTVNAQDAAADRSVAYKSISGINLAANDLSHRYVIFLDGVNTWSTGNPPLNGDFNAIRQQLSNVGISKFVYFSYAAARHPYYCLGWGSNSCSTAKDLSELSSPAIYSKDDTHLPVFNQSSALEWLIRQIVIKDPSAQIDMVGFSLGGIIASYWGSHQGVISQWRSHIHGIIAIESPLGGLPKAADCVPTNYLKGFCDLLYYKFGKNLLRELQLPGTSAGSIVNELPLVASQFYFTSIQSSTDYVVNGLEFSIATITFNNNTTPPYTFPIGRGSQDWGKSPQYFHDDFIVTDLGFASGPKLIPVGQGGDFDFEHSEAYIWITTNHSAPLSSIQVTNLVINAIQHSIPSCPQSGGVILYYHANFDCNGQGANNGYVQRTNAGLQNITGIMNDKASSVIIPTGGSVMLYEHADRGGGKKCLNSTDSGLHDFNFLGNFPNTSVPINDHVSSFEVFTGSGCTTTITVTPPTPDGIEVCDGTNYGASCKTYTYTSNNACTNLASEGWDNKIESLRLKGAYAGGYEIILYDDSFCGVYIARYGTDASSLGMLNNLTGSFRIEQRPPPTTPSPNDGIDLCENTNWGAPCKTYTHISDGACTNLARDGWDNKLESLRFKGSYVDGYEIILYDDNSCGTYIARYGNDANTLGMLNNLTGSFRIEDPPIDDRDYPPEGFTWCADEGNRCNFGGTADIVYGAQRSWTSPRSFTDGVDCNNSIFGDPIVGPRKKCYIKIGDLPGIPCAKEGDMCSFGSNNIATVYYGLYGKYYTKTGVVSSISCSNGPFGGDPYIGLLKACYYIITGNTLASASTAVNVPSINLGGTALVTVSLNNVLAEGYTSAEFTCNYIPTLLEVSNITIGSLFGADPVGVINGPHLQGGSFIVAIAGSKGNKATTSGAAFTFNVKALQGGQTSAECTARVSKGDGKIISLTSTGPVTLTIGGTVTPTASPSPTASATPTFTSTATKTPTPSSTPTSTATPTATTQPSGTLTGRVIACKTVTVDLRNASLQLVTAVNANPDGTFTITVPAGEYIVEADAKGFLWSRTVDPVIISSGVTTLATITLLPGDIFKSDILIQAVIDEWDALTIGMNYNNSIPTDADLNCDGVIDLLDLELLAKNYRKTGPVAWQ